MDHIRFDGLTREFFLRHSRRGVLSLVSTLVATRVLAAGVKEAQSKKKKSKKITLCLGGQTMQASKDKSKKLRKRGATSGACQQSPPGSCAPTCSGQTCGTPDGCGGTCACAANALCHGGVCHPCTITCDGNATECGSNLQSLLAGGGTVFLCPGRYVGTYTLPANISIIGAGEGDDPATSTILDAESQLTTVTIAPGATGSLRSLRITGGSRAGILVQGALTMANVTVTENSGSEAGGIEHRAGATGPVSLSNCTITRNISHSFVGAGLSLRAAQNVTIESCLIANNEGAIFGGGIFQDKPNTSVRNTAIRDNHANTGGGLYTDGGSIQLDPQCSITGNTATSGFGGGIMRNTGTINLNGATVSGNSEVQCWAIDC